MNIKIIQDLLGSLAKSLVTGALALDSQYLCCLKVNTLEMTLEFVEQQNCLFVYLNVGVFLTMQRDRLLVEDVLAANLLHYGTNGGQHLVWVRKPTSCFCFSVFRWHLWMSLVLSVPV
ncbi:type III secretion system chaperone [Pantoea agglomerans]|uniref:type III secretion system chaperone n=1 Tax=Enterobacter agglomerans TaxID=549 RepID=UPI001E54815C|nr:type III secretion system chaperone [Pantoea agglomerans]WHU90647.1 type III secretion system chaperone [Pantoea agglomerans pv. gypsophilae]